MTNPQPVKNILANVLFNMYQNTNETGRIELNKIISTLRSKEGQTMSSDYTAKDIKILSAEEADNRILFQRIQTLSKKYCTASDYIRRLMEAALQVGEDFNVVERRYLMGDKTAVVSSEFREAYLDEMKSLRMK